MNYNKITLCILSAFLLCGMVPLQAQEGLQKLLPKDEAVRMMLDNNFGVKIANNEVLIAENNSDFLNSGYLPTIFGLAGASFDKSSSVTDFGGALGQDGNPRSDIVIDGAETTRYNASINLDYTIFDGLGRRYNYQQLKEQYNLSQLEARETIENTIIQLFSVYYEVARIEENIDILEEALSISKKRGTRSEYQFEYGQTNKLQVLNAQVDITTDSINLLNARQQLQNAQRDLNVVLASDLEDLKIADTTVVFIPPLRMDNYVQEAIENNVSLLQIEQNIVISDYQIKGAKAVFLPTVGLTGSYGWNRANNPASAFFPSTTNRNNNLALGANLRWNLFDGGRSVTDLKNARIALQSQELVREQLQQQVFRDIANANGDYNNALAIYKLQEQNVITNQANFERSQEQFKLGQVTSIEFRQAQLNLLNAQVTKNAAKYTAKIAELRLLQLSGQLLNVTL